MKLTIQVAGKTDVGLVRANNEDNLGFDTTSGVFVVCDGMGGQAAGERASKIAVDTVMGYFRKGANAGQDIRYTGMGTTIVAVAVEGDEFSVAHVGDSRAYLLRGGVIQQLTNVHSLVMEQVRRGLMTPEDAEKSTVQNV